MKDLPIGFIDSGFGGLTVVKQSIHQLPNESIIYIGDSARAPYGPRSKEEVKKYTWQLTNFLKEKGIKMLVIACNTATAAALEELRATLPIPVVGVIHAGSRAALKHSTNNNIGVIGTQGTIDSNLYEKVLHEKSRTTNIYSHAVPEFVKIVEEEKMNDPSTQNIVNQALVFFNDKNIDTLVLGCTHYPHLRKNIRKAVGEDIYLIDSGVETINEVSAILDYFNLSRSSNDAEINKPTHEIYTTGDPGKFGDFSRKWLNQPEIFVKRAYIKGEVIVENTNSES